MTDEEIVNIYIHMTGKAEGIHEMGGDVNFPVLFARAIQTKREWVGLTDEERNVVYCLKTNGEVGFYARAIEAKLKEKNI